MKSLRLIVMIFISLASLTACISHDSEIDYQDNLALLNRGIEIYRANYCGSCHTLSIANTRGMFAPDHDYIIENANSIIRLEAYVGHAESAEAYIYESIVNPTIFYTPGYEASNHHMPAFNHLSHEDLAAMVYMLMNQDLFDDSE